MGYDLHIVKLQGEEDIDIQKEEWLNFANTDPELEKNDEIVEHEIYWEWNGHPEHTQRGARPWFHYSHGSISSKNPDDSVARKMYQIATQLNAKVRGDDGEFYDENGMPLPTENFKPTPFPASKKPWWRFW